jgi:hypothetical protein
MAFVTGLVGARHGIHQRLFDQEHFPRVNGEGPDLRSCNGAEAQLRVRIRVRSPRSRGVLRRSGRRRKVDVEEWVYEPTVCAGEADVVDLAFRCLATNERVRFARNSGSTGIAAPAKVIGRT